MIGAWTQKEISGTPPPQNKPNIELDPEEAVYKHSSNYPEKKEIERDQLRTSSIYTTKRQTEA